MVPNIDFVTTVLLPYAVLLNGLQKKSMAMNVLSTIALKLVACNVVNIVSLLLVNNYRYRFVCFFDT